MISSGIKQLDNILDGGVFIGDNVVWYDDAGSLAHLFCLNFINSLKKQEKPLIYLSFDRSIKNLLEQLGPFADYPLLTIMDCFSCGKGEGADVFLKFYEGNEVNRPCRIIRVDEPRNADYVTGAFYGLHKSMDGDVGFIFDSLTGMQELWGGEEQIIKFYSHSCPRLYELDTIAYWIVEKDAHSQRFKAHINKIAQVAIDLSIKRGSTSLTVVKAEKRDINILNEPFYYWNKGLDITFDSEKRSATRIDIGVCLKELRLKKGLSQTELAKLVGVTSSTISQVENNQIYPSLPALFKIAQTLSVETGYFFKELGDGHNRVVFPASEAVDMQFKSMSTGSVFGKLLTPLDFEPKAEPYIIEIPAEKNLPAHFFIHKGEEMGYLLSGVLQMKLKEKIHTLGAGDVVYLTSEMPSEWKNPGPDSARLLWIKVR